MSRIGILPIEIPKDVQVNLDENNTITVKGPKGELRQDVDKIHKITIDEGQINIARPSDQKVHKSRHGLYRALLYNMIEGVSKGYEKKLELVGVGYRADNKAQLLDMVIGYSHHVYFEMPPEVEIECKTEKRKNSIITLRSADKQLLGQVVSKIRSLRPPEPYKGKGIRFVGENVRRKAGKAASV